MTAQRSKPGICSTQDYSFEAVYVARQPVFDRSMNIWGYELLFREGQLSSSARIQDGNIATSKVIMDGFSLASDLIARGQRLLINYPEEMILQGAPNALPSETAVVEILETVRPTEAILRRCSRLKSEGYLLALDDFVGQPEYEPILNIADLVKIDVLDMKKHQIEVLVSQFKSNHSVQLLAEKVEDQDMYNLCRELEFDLFQGYFFSRPEIISGKKLSASHIARLEVLNVLNSADLDLKLISEIIQHDISLSYRLLRYINSPGIGVTHVIKSINQAVTLLGQQRIAAWLRVLIMADLNSSPRIGELLFTSLQRARFLESITMINDSVPLSRDNMFLLGLFSQLDAIMVQPMEELVCCLSLEEEVKNALLGHNQDLKQWLDLAVACERAKWEETDHLLRKLEISPAETAKKLNQAMVWTKHFLNIARLKP
ncbi:EAL and HDOD domain-containing protein [Desulfonatronovibrio magnus]|uniref:EAL and HDOD domain-containing protein n=1 Tax=Desulfonatronovibrio magnus TaxID=698827 RepID=UPI0005EB7905|nr:HDOD domain-containing protein [Desulfonatronovibrio magnus]